MHILSTSASPESARSPFITPGAPLKPRPDQRELWLAHSAPKPFDDAASEVIGLDLHDGRRDDIVVGDLRAWAFGSSDGTTAQLASVLGDRRPPYALRELGFAQLCTRLGAPAGYVRDLPGRLQVACLNHGLVNAQQPALLRLAGGEVRAVLGGSYAPVDDADLLELVADALDHHGLRSSAMVRASATGTTTLMRITLPGDPYIVKPGDVVESGIDLTNSEVGLRSVGITPISYRLVCSNGLRAWRSESTSRFRHVGDPKRLRELLRGAIPVALAEARGDLERWRRAVDLIADSALEEIESLRGFGLGSGETQAVGRHLALEQGASSQTLRDFDSVAEMLKKPVTVFDLTNAITATARDRSTTTRIAMEEAAGGYLARRTR